MAVSKPSWSQYEGIASMFKIRNNKELPAMLEDLSIRQCLQQEPAKHPTTVELEHVQ
jgi:hypothetical protein